MNEMAKELCGKFHEADGMHRICAAIETVQGTFYVYSHKETDSTVHFSAVSAGNGNIRVYPDLTLQDEESIMKIDYSSEWIGKEAEDLILHYEAEKVSEAVNALNMHIAHREEILNDPFLRF